MTEGGSRRLRAAASAHLDGTLTAADLYRELRDGAAELLEASRESGLDGRPEALARVRAEARAVAEALRSIRDAEPADATPRSGQIYTDGSAVPNPGEGGWAAVWVDGDTIVREVSGGVDETTNNRMELRALIAAFEMVPRDATVEIISDSRLAVQTVNEWGPKWRAAGWRKSRGTIANLDLVKRALTLRESRPACTVRWTRGHADNRWNDYADQRARGGALRARTLRRRRRLRRLHGRRTGTAGTRGGPRR